MNDNVLAPAIRRVRIKQLTIYEISDDELKSLEAGSPASIYLNFAIFLISTAISFLVSLVTSTFPSDHIYMIFVLVIAVFFVIGFFLFILWFREHRSISRVAESIRNRVSPEGEPEQISNQSNDAL